MQDFSDFDVASKAVCNPTTPGTDLAIIAQYHASLRAQIAAHPNAYDQLLDWMNLLGNPEVSRIVAGRKAARRAPGWNTATEEFFPPATLPLGGGPDPIAELMVRPSPEPTSITPPRRKPIAAWKPIAIVLSLVLAMVSGGIVALSMSPRTQIEPPIDEPIFDGFDHFGNDRYNDVMVLDDGRVVLLGSSESQAVIQTVYPDGTVEQYDVMNTYVRGVATGDSIVVVGGPPPYFDMEIDEAFVSKITPPGLEEVIGFLPDAQVLFDIAAAPDGTYIALGADSANRTVVYRLDSNMNPIEFRNPGAGDFSINWGGSLNSVAVAPDGSIFVAGYTDTSGFKSSNSMDAVLTKFTPQGELLWTKTYGGSGEDVFTRVTVADNGDVILVGGTYSTNGDLTASKGEMDALIIRVDSEGNLIWSTTAGDISYDRFVDAVIGKDGNIAVAGWTNSTTGTFGSSYGGSDGVVAYFSPTGELLWSRTFGGSDNDELTALAMDSSGNIIAVGFTTSTDGNLPPAEWGEDAVIVRLTPQGDIIPQ